MIARVYVSAGRRAIPILAFRDALRSGTCSSQLGFRGAKAGGLAFAPSTTTVAFQI
jgi:hypothetical protein